jgi:hypothetical protein
METTTTQAEQVKTVALNALTKVVTAFRTWDEFKAAMEGGYCPTLRVEKLTRRMSQKNRFFKQCTNKLRDMVRAEGFKVFDGQKVA